MQARKELSLRIFTLRTSLALLGLLLPIVALPADNASNQRDESVLFINTSPLGARILLNGKELPGRTPLLLRDVEAGTYSLATLKEGFPSQSIEFSLSPEGKKAIDIEMPKLFFQQTFPGEDTILINRRSEGSSSDIFLLEEGDYDVARKADRLEVGVRFPQQSLIDGLNLAIPVSLLLSGVVTAGEILFPTDINQPISPIVLTSHAITLTLIGVDAALHIKKSRYLSSRSFEVKKKQGPYSFEEYYQRAERYFAAGRMDDALDYYTQALSCNPESPLFPTALYKVAKIHQIRGENTMALSEYSLLVTEYPTVQLYDKAQKSLSDLRLIDNRFEESLNHLRAMVRMDTLYSNEELDLTGCEILEQWYGTDETRLDALDAVVEAYRGMIETYVNSEKAPLYRYKLALYLFAKGEVRESQGLLEALGDLSGDPDLQRKKMELLEKIRQPAEAEHGLP